MTQILCIANQKGGVGKTTTAINLSAALAEAGQRTLLVDCDPQANATIGLGVQTHSDQSLYHGLIGHIPASSLLTDTGVEGLQMIPSHEDLTGFEVEIMSHPERDRFLKRFLSGFDGMFDYILIDCPPSLSLLTVNAMTAADAVLIPLQSEFYALDGLRQLLQTVKRIKSGPNPGLDICGIVLTMADQRTNLSRQVEENARNYFKNENWVFKTMIPRNVRLGEAPSFGRTIFQHDASSAGAKSYLALAQEVMARSTL